MPCHTAVIIRSHIILWNNNTNLFLLSRCQLLRLRKPNQPPGRISQFPLRNLHINLNNLFPPYLTGIRNRRRHRNLIPGILKNLRSRLKSRIRQPIPKRIKHLILRKRLKITISDINIFLIIILKRIPKILSRWIILNISSNRIRQLTTRTSLTSQHISNTISTFLATLPYIQNSLRMILLHPAHINNITNIKHNNRTLTHLTDTADHILLRLRQTITASLRIIILILTRSSANNNQRNIIPARTVKHLLCHIHLLLTPRHTPPTLTFIIRILHNPILINPHQLLIQMNPFTLLQSIQNPHDIPRIHQTTRAKPTLIIMKRHTSKNSNPLPISQRKRLSLILQQHTPLSHSLSRQCSILLQIQLITIHNIYFLSPQKPSQLTIKTSLSAALPMTVFQQFSIFILSENSPIENTKYSH